MRSFCRPRKQWHYMESAKKSYPFTGDVWIGQFDIRDERHATNMHPSTPLCLHYIMLSAIRQVCHSKGPGTIAVWDKKTIRCTFGMGRLVPRRVNRWFLRPFWCLDQPLLPLILGSLTEKLTQCLSPILLGRTHERSARNERSSCNLQRCARKTSTKCEKICSNSKLSTHSRPLQSTQKGPETFPDTAIFPPQETRRNHPPVAAHVPRSRRLHLAESRGGCPPSQQQGQMKVFRDPLLKMEST